VNVHGSVATGSPKFCNVRWVRVIVQCCVSGILYKYKIKNKKYKNTKTQNTKTQKTQKTQKYKNTKIQKYKNTKIQKYKNTKNTTN
jgi:hypothetical protein